jgi:hypothetical protein
VTVPDSLAKDFCGSAWAVKAVVSSEEAHKVASKVVLNISNSLFC